jgi:hypothetical protein
LPHDTAATRIPQAPRSQLRQNTPGRRWPGLSWRHIITEEAMFKGLTRSLLIITALITAVPAAMMAAF